MKPVTINVQITKSPKQFEAVRIGMEATLDPNETVEGAIKEATAQLNAIYAEMYNPQPKVAQNSEKTATNENEPQPTEKKLLKIGDKEIAMIIKRIEKDPKNGAKTIETAKRYYDFEPDALKTLELSAQLNSKL